jgi:hypothetical protein
MPTPTRASSREKVNAYRARMKKKGMRLIQMWVPDTRSAAFRRQARRDGLAVANSAHAAADQAFVDAISAWDADA